MPGSWLLLPILFPLLGGLGVLGIHTLKTRRRVISILLALQLVLVAVLGAQVTEHAQILTLAVGVRLVLQMDALGRLFSLLICGVWLAVAVFAF